MRLGRIHYNYFRDYDPQTGRYVESDPSGLRGGVNTYDYVRDNPISRIDAMGLLPGDPFSTIGGAANDALNFANPMSIAGNGEYAGLIYQDPATGLYYAMPPIPTGREGGNNLHLPYLNWSIPVADYHTHGNYCHGRNPTNKSHDIFDSDHFSRPDLDFAKTITGTYPNWMRYLGTPSGVFYQYSPNTGLDVLNPN